MTARRQAAALHIRLECPDDFSLCDCLITAIRRPGRQAV